MAEYIARSSHHADVSFMSAGTYAASGAGPSHGSVEVLAEVGIEVGKHRSRSIFEAVPAADILLALAVEHFEALVTHWPMRRADISMLRPDGQSIADPYGAPLDEYRITREEITSALSARASLWEA